MFNLNKLLIFKFFSQFYAENPQFNEWGYRYEEMVLECGKIKKWDLDPVFQICLDLAYENPDSAQKFLDEYVAKQNP